MKKSTIILASLLGSLWILGSTVPSHADFFDVTYNSNAEQLLFTSSQAQPPEGFSPGDCPDCIFNLFNNTGTTWTDFHFRVAFQAGSGLGGTFGFIDAAVGGYDGDVYEGPGSDTVGPFNQTLDVVGLNIVADDEYTFNVDMDAFELTGNYQLFGIPTTDGGNGRLPLPGTFLLLAGGLVGLTGMAWRQRRRN